MNNESDLWNCEGYLDNGSEATLSNPPAGSSSSGLKNNNPFPASGNPAWTSNNTDTVYPLFGAYAGTTATPTNKGNDYSDYLDNPNLLCPAAVSGNSLYNNNMIGKANTMHDLTSTAGHRVPWPRTSTRTPAEPRRRPPSRLSRNGYATTPGRRCSPA